MSETNITNIWQPEVTASNEPEYVRKLRSEAARAFSELPHPTRIDEPWRRTVISSVPFADFSEKWNAESSEAAVDTLIPDNFQRIVTGQTAVKVHLTSQPGVVAMPLTQAIATLPESQLSDLLGWQPSIAFHRSLYRFQAAVHAFRNAGCFVDVAASTDAKLPLGLLTTLYSESSAIYTQNVIRVGRNSRLELAEEFASPVDKRALLSLSHTRIILEEGATLQFTALQNWGAGVYHFGTHHITLKAGAKLNAVIGGLGGRIAKSRIMVEFAGEGSDAKIGGFIAASGKQHLDHDTTQRHIARHTTSDLLFKGVVDKSSRSVYQGMIVVEQSAQQTDAYQSVKHLSLSPKAHVDALPGLEILADDVRCTHGATTTPIDPEQLYFMAARGLSKTAATELLVEAHLDPIIARIPNNDLQQKCRDAVSLKLVGHTL